MSIYHILQSPSKGINLSSLPSTVVGILVLLGLSFRSAFGGYLAVLSGVIGGSMLGPKTRRWTAARFEAKDSMSRPNGYRLTWNP
jgi:hypothetical protein